MKRLYILSIAIVGIYACTSEPELFNFSVSIKNSTSSDFNIKTYSDNIQIDSIDVNTGDSGLNCVYTDENFRGIFSEYCGIDSLIITFDNMKGYISKRFNDGAFNFSDKRNPLLPNGGFLKNSNNIYEFIITQEDYENAHELP